MFIKFVIAWYLDKKTDSFHSDFLFCFPHVGVGSGPKCLCTCFNDIYMGNIFEFGSNGIYLFVFLRQFHILLTYE